MDALKRETLPETNIFAPENGWDWNTILSFWVKRPIFRGKIGELLVSGRGCTNHRRDVKVFFFHPP